MLPNGLKVAEFFLSYLLADGGQTTTGSLKPLWKNGQSQKSVCTQKKPSWSHWWELGRGRAWNSLQRESALVLGTQRKGSSSHFPALPQVWDPMKFWFQKAKVHIPALLLWGDPFPIEKTIKPNPCLRKKWKQSISGPGGNSHSQVTQRLSEALNPS